tara:strand:- start:45 stop:545 length:501 start_codon:yes stop_codon:yes gene_type:complete
MIDFVLKDRRLRLYPDGVIRGRSIKNGVETKNETWRIIKFHESNNGYQVCGITVDGCIRQFSKHRLIKLAHNPSWDIFDSSQDNCIDHINHIKADNTDENLRVVTNQQNQFNRSNTKGYIWSKPDKKWKAQIVLNKTQIHLGMFKNEEDARAAYLKAKERLHRIPK